MLKKFLIGTVVALALLVGVTASAAYDFGPTTLRVGSSGQYVMNVQTVVGATADGAFGNMTKAKVMAWQASHGLVADGVVGPATKNAMNAGSYSDGVTVYPAGCTSAVGYSTTTGLSCATTTTYPAGCTSAMGYSSTTGAKCDGGSVTTGPLTGGAGELIYASTTSGLESNVKEGATEKVLASKVEADGSDIAFSSVKVSFENNSGNGSTRLNKYIEKVSVMLGSAEVGSADADDFSKDGDVYTKSIALSGAVVKEGDAENLYVAVSVLNTVDEDTASFYGIIEQVRWMDATGVIFSDTDSDGSDFGTGAAENFGFDAASADDDIDIKSSSTDPDASTLLVDANDTSEEHLIGVFKLDVDEDSSDILVSEFPILVTFTASGNTTDDANADDAGDVIDELRVTVDGKDYTATLEDSEVTNGAGRAVYLVDDEFTVASGDVVDVKIYATFTEQDSNYGSGQVISVSTDEDVTENTPDYSWSAEGEDELDVDGTFSGKDMTLSTTSAIVSGITWEALEGGAGIELTFKVEAEEDSVDVTLAALQAADTVTTTGTVAAPTLSKVSGSATDNGGNSWTIEDGDNATFSLVYTNTGANGTNVRVIMSSIAGQNVPDDKEVSPLVVRNVN